MLFTAFRLLFLSLCTYLTLVASEVVSKEHAVSGADVSSDDEMEISVVGVDGKRYFLNVPKKCKGEIGIKGAKGDIGPNGPKGDVGGGGARGTKGGRGARGARGPIGPPGSDGKRGGDGKAGPPAAPGKNGERGIAGPKGDSGPVGIKGNRGAKGDAGTNGLHGMNGAPGSKGSKGDIGPNGSPGVKGDPGKGIPGARGITGPTGPTGAVGGKGERGAKGNDGRPGLRGKRGGRGKLGHTGKPGVGLRGHTGKKGERGMTGIKGERGAAGKKGPIGFAGQNGARGSVGSKGARGVIGRKGERGVAGRNGNRGPVGHKGVRGPVGGRGGRGTPGTRGQKGEAAKSNPKVSSCWQLKTKFRAVKFESGEYRISLPSGEYKVYCEMGINGGGYTFIPRAMISKLSHADLKVLYKHPANVLMRTSRPDGTQPYTVIAQHKLTGGLSVQANSHTNNNRPVNKHMGRYLLVSTLPNSAATNGAFLGFRSNNKNVLYKNCNGRSNVFVFYSNPHERQPSTYHKNNLAYERSGVAVKWRRSAVRPPSGSRIPLDYFLFTEMHFGGCGCYTSSDRWLAAASPALGTAIGIR